MSKSIRVTLAAAMVAAALASGMGTAQAQSRAPTDPWPDIARDAFDNRPVGDGTGLLVLDMPIAVDAAGRATYQAPVRATLPPGDTRAVTGHHHRDRREPLPGRGDLQPRTERSGVSEISTRVRVNSYTNVHAVAELSDGKLYGVQTYVKASGGCSAPAAKDADEAKVHLGQLRFRQFAKAPDGPASAPREAQIMIRHPNNSGLQMDQVTRLYVPAFFVHNLEIRQGDDLILAMDGGISISEDPNLRFTYRPNGAGAIRVEARDTDAHVFQGEWPADAPPM